MTLGFIGLGVMGLPMALHLRAAGFPLHAHSRSGTPEPLLAAGALSCPDPATVLRTADVVFLMLPDTPDVEDVLFGPCGAMEAAAAGKTIVDLSSISPEATRRIAQRLAAAGVDYADAPVSGGEVGARTGSLSIMVGATVPVFERVQPLLKAMGKHITHVGGIGAGQVAKIANQIVVGINLAAVAEALVFAANAGADVGKVRDALMGGFAASRVLDLHGRRMISRSFEPGFRIALHHKDLRLAADSAAALGLNLPNLECTRQLMERCEADGWAGLDHAAVIKGIEAGAITQGP